MRRVLALSAMAAAVLLTAAAPSPWVFEPDGSRIEMSVRAFGGSHVGRFSDWRGEAALDANRPESARATVTVQAGSLRMSPAAVTERAVGPGFLDAERYPTIRFDLKSLEPLGGSRYSARAEVTVKGRRRDIVFPVDLRVAGQKAHLTGAFTLDRADFGIGTSGPWNRLVGRQVRVQVALQARPA
ncbi:MAG TPA: YceI family protein [Brevundimonas sp.]|nr:YceI family protein [Brevundimonas sp.]